MAVKVQCPSCGKSMNVSEELLGRMLPCSGCGEKFTAKSIAAPLGGSKKPKAKAGKGGKGEENETPVFSPPALIGGGAALLVVIIVIAVMFSGGGEPQPAPVAAQPVAPPAGEPTAAPAPAETPAAPSFRLSEMAGIVLNPGASAVVDVKVERAGQEGPIEITTTGLPANVTAKPLSIPADQSAGKLEIAAAANATPAELSEAKVVASAGSAKIEQKISISVKPMDPPRLLPIAGTVLKPGGTANVSITIERSGNQGPIEVALSGLPPNVTAKPVSVAPDQTAAIIAVTAAPNAAETQKLVHVTAKVGQATAETDFELNVESAAFKVALLPVPAFRPTVLHVKPGAPQAVQVSLERRSYKGPLQLELSGLPAGVTAPGVVVPPDQALAKLVITVPANVTDMVRTAKLTTTGGTIVVEEPVIMRIAKGGEGEIDFNIDPEAARLMKKGSFGGRLRVDTKQLLLDLYGGTEESEAAVLRGLEWLAIHQNKENGQWALEAYGTGVEGCDCKTPIEAEVKAVGEAGTALALLPFLAAGVTHKSAPQGSETLKPYQHNVEGGLAYLARMQKHSADTSDGFLGGQMYSHALGTIALCEAYGMTKDERLLIPSQKALKYLANSQNGTDGGWRYGPRQPGDTSVVAWVFLAIRSGQMAGLTIDREMLKRAGRYMNNAAAGPSEARFSRYAYQPGGKETVALSAAGLLTRQYLGWDPDQPDLLAGSNYLMSHFPPSTGKTLGPMYYYYYATQVLHHMEGENWDKWNYHMREHLLRTQEKEGHAAGSWSAEGTDWGRAGGRLYSTSLAILTLETYYRHLPLYRQVIKPPKIVIEE